jgi:hypothetical protein
MPRIGLSQIRSLLPYAAKLLPVLTGVAIELPARPGPELAALDRHVGEIETASRGLRQEIEGQGQRLDGVARQVEELGDAMAEVGRRQRELARSLAVVRLLAAGGTLLLVAAVVLLALLLARTGAH